MYLICVQIKIIRHCHPIQQSLQQVIVQTDRQPDIHTEPPFSMPVTGFLAGRQIEQNSINHTSVVGMVKLYQQIFTFKKENDIICLRPLHYLFQRKLYEHTPSRIALKRMYIFEESIDSGNSSPYLTNYSSLVIIYILINWLGMAKYSKYGSKYSSCSASKRTDCTLHVLKRIYPQITYVS